MPNYKLDTDERVCFYEQEFYVLSNYSSFTLEWNGLRFDTSEAAYHWEKFAGYPPLQELIRTAGSAHHAQVIANANAQYRREDWDQVKVGIMYDILHAKVDQHGYVKKKLIETGTRELVEDSWRDGYWGWGEEKNGKNVLGKLWMKVRESYNTGVRQPIDGIG